MRDRSDRYQIQNPLASTTSKRIGSYFVEAGLLTPDQVSVVLNDQQATGMRFGEIVVARGWLKEQTIEWVVMKVVEPERQSVQPSQPPAHAQASRLQLNQQTRTRQNSVPQMPLQPPMPLRQTVSRVSVKNGTSAQPTLEQPTGNSSSAPTSAPSSNEAHPTKPFVRRDIPISKPLPSVGSTDSDVNWVG